MDLPDFHAMQQPPQNEPRETRERRLYMRSIRRGTKEMDVILTKFAQSRLSSLSDEGLEVYDSLLRENDQDLYQWVSGQVAPPIMYKNLVSQVIDEQT